MNNTLAQDYAREQEIRRQYDAADAQGSSEGKEAARAAYKALTDSIAAKGEAYAKVYRLYSGAQERGNAYIDLNEVIWDEKVKETIDALRENGISHFTFSSGWSSAVETAWLFTQNGCQLEGLVEINSPHKAFGSEEYEKAHGYLFSIG